MVIRKTQYLNYANDIGMWITTWGINDFSKIISIKIERCNDFEHDHNYLIIIETRD